MLQCLAWLYTRRAATYIAEVWQAPFDVLEGPRDAALRLAADAGLAWLDGGLEHGSDGRFSFVASQPCQVVSEPRPGPDALAVLTRLALPSACENTGPLRACDVPAWVGHVAYDALHPSPHAQALAPLPAVRFARYRACYAYDHHEARGYLVGDDEAACTELRTRLERPEVSALDFTASLSESTTPAQHQRAIVEALSLIREGEVYEINLARRYRARFAGNALALFLRMRALSPVPLGYFVDGGDHAIAGRSMERFLRFAAHDRSLITAPIKGTLARAGDDTGEAAALLQDPKERAEHVMVVDLMRNDLSRVCAVGTVELSELMAVYPFAGLSHLISTVRGRVRDGVDLREILEQTFPPGSITGAPKERVMRAISELERIPRGVYTGCYGFLDRAGGASFAVAIRTAAIANGWADYFAGGGIVADSDPQRETDETELKAQLFLRAIA